MQNTQKKRNEKYVGMEIEPPKKNLIVYFILVYNSILRIGGKCTRTAGTQGQVVRF